MPGRFSGERARSCARRQESRPWRDHGTRRKPLHERAVSGSITDMERPRRTTRWTNVVLASGAIVLCLVALDRLVAWTDLGYRAARYRPNEDRQLTRDEFNVHIATNALGVRRVVVLGDSFTQGYGVEESEAYPRGLERRLATAGLGDVQVVNLGVPGT